MTGIRCTCLIRTGRLIDTETGAWIPAIQWVTIDPFCEAKDLPDHPQLEMEFPEETE